MQLHIHAILLSFCDAWSIKRSSLYDFFCFLYYKQQVLVEFGLNKKVLVVRGDNSSLQAFEIDGEMRTSER